MSWGERLRSRLGSNLILGAAFLVAAAAIAGTGIRFTIQPTRPPAVHATLTPRLASYLGVYERGVPPAYDPVTEFAAAAGEAPNLVGYYSGWAEPFPISFANVVRSHGAIPYVQIDPTLASVAGIAAGAYDIYLRAYADSVRDFGHAVVIGFGHEMNAPWYPWGFGHVRSATFIAAWRHIVTLFRLQGADNVTWLWTVNQDRPGTGPVQDWWPGASYVTWIGIDGYYFRPTDTFASVFGKTIGQVRLLSDKPILLSETSVSRAAGQFAKIGNLFTGIRAYRTLGLVWFDIDQHGSARHQDWRIEDDEAADAAFRLGISELTLARPSK
jgi:mannan endo-1,4-beta-mannosidase